MIDEKFEEKWLGKGAFGQVYERVGHVPPAVVKYINCPEPNLLIAYRKECNILKQMSHPNIVNLIQTEESPERKTFAIVMEFCERGTLRHLIANATIIFTVNTVIHWAKQMFHALSYMFQVHKVIHRDIKPENIFVTKGFHLKIGDFGCVKLSEHTISCATWAGTERYMSPPQLENGQLVDVFQASHRNDVYSMGLVLWEIIERRLVLSECCEWNKFNRDTFLFNFVYAKTHCLELPNCQKRLQEIFSRCTCFDLSSRPNAQEILIELESVVENDDFLMTLEFLPREETHQKKLLRPIGFNGKAERVSIESQETAGSSLLNLNDSGSNECDESSKFIESFSEAKRDHFIPYCDTRRRLLQKKFEQLTSEQKSGFVQQTVPRILGEKMDKNHTFDLIAPEHKEKRESVLKSYSEKSANCEARTEAALAEVPLLSKEPQSKDFNIEFHDKEEETLKDLTVEELFAMAVEKDFHELFHLVTDFFKLLTGIRKDCFSPWSNYQRILWCIGQFSGFKSKQYTTRIRFKCFLQTSTHQEWLLINKESQKFVRSDFVNVQTFEGVWLHKGHLLAVKGKPIGALLEHDELRFTRLMPIDLFKIVESLWKLAENYRKLGEIKIQHYLPLEESQIKNTTLKNFKTPIPGYVFQLRNPPRHICDHEPKCLQIRFDPYARISDFPELAYDSNPKEMQILIYECTPAISLDFLEFYFLFLDELHDVLAIDNPVGMGILPFARQLRLSALKTEQFLCLSSDIDLLVNEEPLSLTLLDHPDNYEIGEKVAGFTKCFEFYWLDRDEALKGLKSDIYTVIHKRFEGWSVSSNGQQIGDSVNLLMNSPLNGRMIFF